MVQVKVSWVQGADETLGLPSYQTAGAAGADVRANLPDGTVSIAPGQRVLIPSGLCMEIPPGYEIQIRPRSGLALKHGVMLLNSPGTIDSDYRGPVGIILLNGGQKTVEITHGMRIAQLVLAPVVQADFASVTALGETERGAGGFGSTGRG
ncbi:Deoxyuridine 5'-triphosphate nucleotidohydrolase [Roseobacter fucihabitans]|uniref:Deoxyuridine 5'-triphosphate nucleotidohydrolase n=1 Tax=Roseobacter fucihabitans TaxID=1537242 RepID=A0ABZ2BWS3_9RHOB|nr:dUTP diphosphatase [Roseobacter litoralis]MBC6964530.1 Deoxyuridine 5'-triphosphate nucleotidohydrolase [Roseobacter litoralis]